MLGVEELCQLEEAIKERLNERLEEILTKLNRSGSLLEFLQLIGMSELLGKKELTIANRNGRIIVIGESEVEREILVAVAKRLGFDKNRFEFYLNYNDAKAFNFRKTQWSDSYSAILVGQMPHSGSIKGNFGSIISAIEYQEGYPPVYRVGMNGLKITKASFKNTLELLINEGVLA